MRVNLLMPDDLVAKLDERARYLNISRSAYINMSVSRQLDVDQMSKNLPSLIEALNKAVDESHSQRLSIQSP